MLHYRDFLHALHFLLLCDLLFEKNDRTLFPLSIRGKRRPAGTGGLEIRRGGGVEYSPVRETESAAHRRAERTTESARRGVAETGHSHLDRPLTSTPTREPRDVAAPTETGTPGPKSIAEPSGLGSQNRGGNDDWRTYWTRRETERQVRKALSSPIKGCEVSLLRQWNGILRSIPPKSSGPKTKRIFVLVWEIINRSGLVTKSVTDN